MALALRTSRYGNVGWQILDLLTCILMIPFQHVATLTISVFIFTCFDNHSLLMKTLRYGLLGPIMILLSLVLLPAGALGYVLWMLLNEIAQVQPFMYGRPKEKIPLNDRKLSSKRVTVMSANVCLAPEYICRFNNQRNVYWRLGEIGRKLLKQDLSLNQPNLSPPVSRENVVLAEIPDLDVIMLQEVFERTFGYLLYRQLKHKYPYCIYDVGCHSLRGNRGGLGSGLFIASRHPITNARFHPFSVSSGYAYVVNLGVLVVKLDLGYIMKEKKQRQAVGYVATTHAQAYQGPEKIIVKQMEEAEKAIEEFISETRHEDEVLFTVLGGDFNCDNLSPGETATQNSPLWDSYCDPGRESAGEDKPWTVGTEHRQPKMNHPIVQNNQTFRDALLDDVQRRHFILDADVEEQTLELMTCSPKPDANGNVRATKGGGRRRIDYVTCHKESLFTPTGYWFSTGLAGLSDHIPVVIMIESRNDRCDS